MNWWKQLIAWWEPKEKKQEKRNFGHSTQDRWTRLLKALRIAQAQLLPALERELHKGMSKEERHLKVNKEIEFLDGLIFHRKVEALDLFCIHLIPGCLSDHLQTKVPHLKEWATKTDHKGSLLQSTNPEVMAWIRGKKLWKQGAFREAHLAEAVVNGDLERAKIVLTDAKKEKLGVDELTDFLDAFAEKKQNEAAFEGLTQVGLEILVDMSGGWDDVMEMIEGVKGKFSSIEEWLQALIDAVKTEILMETEVLLESEILSKKTKEKLLELIAKEAIRVGNPALLQKVINKLKSNTAQGFMNEKNTKVVDIHVHEKKQKIKMEESISLLQYQFLTQNKEVQSVLKLNKVKDLSGPDKIKAIELVTKELKRHAIKNHAKGQLKSMNQQISSWNQSMMKSAQTTSDMEKIQDQKFKNPKI